MTFIYGHDHYGDSSSKSRSQSMKWSRPINFLWLNITSQENWHSEMTAGFTLTSTDSIIHDFTNNYLYSKCNYNNSVMVWTPKYKFILSEIMIQRRPLVRLGPLLTLHRRLREKRYKPNWIQPSIFFENYFQNYYSAK